jgi:phage replication-related protein YjqB (UPF0714/DUF867 family)
MPHEDRYPNFAALARKEREGLHFRVTVVERPGSAIAVIAPHGGAIERRTAEVARAIAGQEFSSYLFEGTRSHDNYARLHLTSRRFDEPRCLALVRQVETVVAIHGCEDLAGRVYVGGLDTVLGAAITAALAADGFEVVPAGHEFAARDEDNICNRGRSGRGIQLELPRAARGGPFEARLVRAVRGVLLATAASPPPAI